MEQEKIKRIAYTVVAVTGVGLIAFLFFKYIFSLTLPFLIGWCVAFLTRRPAGFISKKTKIPERILRLILALVVSLSILGLLGVGVWRLSLELIELFRGGGGAALGDAISGLVGEGGFLGGVLGELGKTLGDALYQMIMSVVSSLGEVLSRWVGVVPRLILSVLFTVIASIYFSLDLEVINKAARDYLPPGISAALVRFKNGFMSIGVRYISSYLTIMLITFSVMLIGLMILRSPYALLMAVIIALLDVLPVLGVGTVVIPWSLWSFISGDHFMAIGLIVLYVVNEIIRRIVEPKIVGKSLGVHPVITLVLLYVGYSLFGFMGLLLVPVVIVIINIVRDKKDSSNVEGKTSAKGKDA